MNLIRMHYIINSIIFKYNLKSHHVILSAYYGFETVGDRINFSVGLPSLRYITFRTSQLTFEVIKINLLFQMWYTREEEEVSRGEWSV
jgi:hypothetical protein